ncbi:MAG TPA: 4Fe-4S binding protein [Syntrophomonadaceae bacterium]|nr:4Fe-4S binding protein [Syntrophomonadaceae bacterium]
MRIAVAGGKGGTGKTLFAVCLAEYLASPQTVLMDVDVEEPDAVLFFLKTPGFKEIVYRPVPLVNEEKCSHCGYCAGICQFNALVILPEEIMFFPELCHSCRACYYLCPCGAITMGLHPLGEIEEALLANGARIISGCLRIGEPRSPGLIAAVKEREKQASWAIIDCPPGTACPMMEAIRGCDYCLLITEPTPFGAHDLKLSLEAAKLLGIPAGVVINRWRGNDRGIDQVANYAGVPILSRLPLMPELAASYSRGENPLLTFPDLRGLMGEIISQIRGEMQ